MRPSSESFQPSRRPTRWATIWVAGSCPSSPAPGSPSAGMGAAPSSPDGTGPVGAGAGAPASCIDSAASIRGETTGIAAIWAGPGSVPAAARARSDSGADRPSPLSPRPEGEAGPGKSSPGAVHASPIASSPACIACAGPNCAMTDRPEPCAGEAGTVALSWPGIGASRAANAEASPSPAVWPAPSFPTARPIARALRGAAPPTAGFTGLERGAGTLIGQRETCEASPGASAMGNVGSGPDRVLAADHSAQPKQRPRHLVKQLKM